MAKMSIPPVSAVYLFLMASLGMMTWFAFKTHIEKSKIEKQADCMMAKIAELENQMAKVSADNKALCDRIDSRNVPKQAKSAFSELMRDGNGLFNQFKDKEPYRSDAEPIRRESALWIERVGSAITKFDDFLDFTKEDFIHGERTIGLRGGLMLQPIIEDSPEYAASVHASYLKLLKRLTRDLFPDDRQ